MIYACDLDFFGECPYCTRDCGHCQPYSFEDWGDEDSDEGDYQIYGDGDPFDLNWRAGL